MVWLDVYLRKIVLVVLWKDRISGIRGGELSQGIFVLILVRDDGGLGKGLEIVVEVGRWIRESLQLKLIIVCCGVWILKGKTGKFVQMLLFEIFFLCLCLEVLFVLVRFLCRFRFGLLCLYFLWFEQDIMVLFFECFSGWGIG